VGVPAPPIERETSFTILNADVLIIGKRLRLSSQQLKVYFYRKFLVFAVPRSAIPAVGKLLLHTVSFTEPHD